MGQYVDVWSIFKIMMNISAQIFKTDQYAVV